MITVYGLYTISMTRLFMIKPPSLVSGLRLFNRLFDRFDGLGMNIFTGGDDAVILLESPSHTKVELLAPHVCTDTTTLMNQQGSRGMIPDPLFVDLTSNIFCRDTKIDTAFTSRETGIFRLRIHTEGGTLNVE